MSLNPMTGVLIRRGKFGPPHRETMMERLEQSLE